MNEDLTKHQLRHKLAVVYAILGGGAGSIDLVRWFKTGDGWFLMIAIALYFMSVVSMASIALTKRDPTLATWLFLGIGPLTCVSVLIAGQAGVTLTVIVAGMAMMIMLPDNITVKPISSRVWLMYLLVCFWSGLAIRVGLRGYDVAGNTTNMFILVAVPTSLLVMQWVLTQRVFGQLRRSLHESEQLRNALEQNNEELLFSRNAAQEASVAKSRFLANMTHELRTPLNAIIGYSDLVIEEMEEEPEENPWREDLSKIQSSGQHLLTLISDILDLAKIESGHMHLDERSIDVVPLLESISTVCKPLMSSNGNTFNFRCDLDRSQVMVVDDTKLRQVLLNLLSNASKFTSDGEITLAVEMSEFEMVRFVVEDTGIGMTEEQQQRIFEAFEQADSSTTRQYGGTGLGLSLVRELVYLMQGSITMESQLQNGSRFEVTLPIEGAKSRTPTMKIAS